MLVILGTLGLLFLVWEALPDKAKLQLKNVIVNWSRLLISGAIPILDGVAADLEPIVAAFVAAFNRYAGPIASDVRAPISAVARGAFTASADGLTSSGESTPDNALSMASDAFADAFGFGGASAVVTAAFEAAFPEKLNTANFVGPLFANMAGFEEISGAVREPLYKNAFGKSLEYQFRSVFKPELPNEGDAVEWHSRGLLTDDQLRTIFKYSGLKSEYEDAFIKSAYRPVSAFIMLRLMESGVVDNAALRDALSFNGYRPQDQAALIKYAEWAALQNYRQIYLSQVLTAAERGVMSDLEVQSALDDMQAPAGAAHFVQLAIATRKLEQLAELYRRSISTEYGYGLITDAQYVPALEAIGIAQADADAHYAIDSAKLHGKELAAERRAAAREAAQILSAATRAAIINYQAGNIDAVALTAALLAAGQPPALIAAIVDYQAVRKDAAKQYVYGVRLDRQDAQLLRERVAALKEQVVKKAIDPTVALSQLEAWGIPTSNANDLVAAWQAQAYKTATALS